MISLLWSRN